MTDHGEIKPDAWAQFGVRLLGGPHDGVIVIWRGQDEILMAPGPSEPGLRMIDVKTPPAPIRPLRYLRSSVDPTLFYFAG